MHHTQLNPSRGLARDWAGHSCIMGGTDDATFPRASPPPFGCVMLPSGFSAGVAMSVSIEPMSLFSLRKRLTSVFEGGNAKAWSLATGSLRHRGTGFNTTTVMPERAHSVPVAWQITIDWDWVAAAHWDDGGKYRSCAVTYKTFRPRMLATHFPLLLRSCVILFYLRFSRELRSPTTTFFHDQPPQ